MAAVQTVILSVYSFLVSWTYLLLVILLIAKVFMWMTGSNLFGKTRSPGPGPGPGGGGAGGGPQQVQGFHGEMRNP